MIEREPSDYEKHRSNAIDNVGKILANKPWSRNGRLFLGSGTVTRNRAVGYSYGPWFSEKISTRFILGITRGYTHTINVESYEGQDAEGFAAVTTSYSIDLQTQEITVRQKFGDYARNRLYDEEWAKENSSVYGIDRAPEEAQWQALAELTGKWASKHGEE